jgi:hypothetical protein
VSNPSITYAALQDATRETELAVLASIYRLALDSANRNAAGVTSTNGGDATKGSDSDRARTIIQEPN